METINLSTTGFTFAERLTIEGSYTGEFYNGLLRGMTHKLNNLLAVIQGFSSLIMMNDDLDDSIRENLVHMKEAAQNASGLSERILAAGGCVRVQTQRVSLADYIPMIEGGLRAPLARHEVPFALNVAPNVPAVTADSSRLKEVLLELLKNAAEAAAPNGGEVALDVIPPGEAVPGSDRVDIFVRNTGSTIPPEKLSEIFKPFYTTKDSSHYGIGLTSASVLSSQMGMRLGVRSENGVTTFWLSAPASA